MQNLKTELEILAYSLDQIPTNMETFSSSLRYLFSENSIGDSCEVSQSFLEMRDLTKYQSEGYLSNMLPLTKKCLSNIQRSFENYQLNYEQWDKYLDKTIQAIIISEQSATELIEIHQSALPPLQNLNSEAKLLIDSFKTFNLKNEQKKKYLESRAKKGSRISSIVQYIPVIGSYFAPYIYAYAEKKCVDLTAMIETESIVDATVKLLTEELMPSLKYFLADLKIAAMFLSLLKKELYSIKKAKDQSQENGRVLSNLHYELMSQFAPDIIRKCRRIFHIFPTVETDIEAIPIVCENQNYVDKWVENEKKEIENKCSEKVKPSVIKSYIIVPYNLTSESFSSLYHGISEKTAPRRPLTLMQF